jgi:dihydrodipicolinate synthase/N-acetylneuraminate lyase
VIAQSTATCVERIGLAYDLGFRMFQIALPSWGRLTDAETLTFFADICGTFPDSRFLHYNVGRAARLLQPADYRRVADRVENLVATKITGSDLRAAIELLSVVPELQHFFVDLFPAVCGYGECSLLGAAAPMYPARTRELFELGCAGRYDALMRLHGELAAIDREILAPVRGLGLMDGAYDKLRVRLGGIGNFPLRLLSPYATISEDQYRQCARLAAGHREWLR